MVNHSLNRLLKDLERAYEWSCPEDQGKSFAASWEIYQDSLKYEATCKQDVQVADTLIDNLERALDGIKYQSQDWIGVNPENSFPSRKITIELLEEVIFLIRQHKQFNPSSKPLNIEHIGIDIFTDLLCNIRLCMDYKAGDHIYREDAEVIASKIRRHESTAHYNQYGELPGKGEAMPDVVERVAKAIHDNDPEHGSYCWMKYAKTHYIPMAKAAITAMNMGGGVSGDSDKPCGSSAVERREDSNQVSSEGREFNSQPTSPPTTTHTLNQTAFMHACNEYTGRNITGGAGNDHIAWMKAAILAYLHHSSSEIPSGTLLRIIEDSISEAGNAACSIQGEEHTLALAVMKAIEPYISQCEMIVNFPVEACITEMEENFQAYMDQGATVSASVMNLAKGIVQYHAENSQQKREIFLVQEEVDKCKP